MKKTSKAKQKERAFSWGHIITVSIYVTLQTWPLFDFFSIKEKKRMLCLNLIKPLKMPQSKLLD